MRNADCSSRLLRHLRYLRALLLMALLLPCLSTRAQEVSICADPDPPPWTYWVRDSQNEKTSNFTGSSVDTFTAAFSRLGTKIRFIGDLPWARCLQMVQEGKVDFAMDAYYSTERAKVFQYSRHYNTLTPQVFYRAQKPVHVRVVADLKNYRGCGMLGASYEHYKLAATDLDLGVNTYEGMLAKLKAGRCDYFVEELEVISGYKKLGRDLLGDTDLRHNAVSDAQAPAKHLIAAKGSAAAQMLPALNSTLETMIQSNELARIWKKHMPDGPFSP